MHDDDDIDRRGPLAPAPLPLDKCTWRHCSSSSIPSQLFPRLGDANPCAISLLFSIPAAVPTTLQRVDLAPHRIPSQRSGLRCAAGRVEPAPCRVSKYSAFSYAYICARAGPCWTRTAKSQPHPLLPARQSPPGARSEQHARVPAGPPPRQRPLERPPVVVHARRAMLAAAHGGALQRLGPAGRRQELRQRGAPGARRRGAEGGSARRSAGAGARAAARRGARRPCHADDGACPATGTGVAARG
jgi:hypothetical protein